jgi:SAM-dependent methyltransferase
MSLADSVEILKKRIKDLIRRAVNVLPLQPKVVARLESISILESKVQDLQILCAQLKGALKQMGGLMPPPPHLQIRVSGEYNSAFIEHGEILLGYLNSALSCVDKDLTSFDKVLDFGCGCARLLRALHYQAAPSQKLYGTDIDAEAIEWCRANHSKAAEFSVNPAMPPMTYSDDMFDLVYSVSIFTHLPEAMQYSWLKELQRITKPGGYLLLTTHGEKHFHNVPEGSRQAALAKGFYYHQLGNTEGLPDFYQVTYHMPEYIRSRWSDYFDILDIQERAVDDHQDIVLCRKRCAPETT